MGRVLISEEASGKIEFYGISASLVAVIELGVSICVRMLRAFVFEVFQPLWWLSLSRACPD